MLTTLLQSIGNTQLLKLSRLCASLPGNILLKLENKNPGGSVKDRVAFAIIDNAMERGELQTGGTVVEATSGNMGIGLALVCAIRGLSCVLAMPESMSRERRALLHSLGAELLLTPAAQGMQGAVDAARQVALERGAFQPNQFANPDAIEVHYNYTGPEILRDANGEVAALVAGVGSGATLSGTGLFLRGMLPQCHIVAVEPAESPFISQGKAGPHGIQGIGAGFLPGNLKKDLLDEVMTVSTEEARDTARRLMKTEGVCAGFSSGANVAAALRLAARPEMKGRNIVTFACDTGERYMSMGLFTTGDQE